MNRIFRITGIAVLLTTLSAVTTAAGWVADFSLDANATYDDNFLMNDQDQESWIYTLKPEASLIYASPVMTSELQTSLALKRYSEFDQFDSEDPAFDWKNSYRGSDPPGPWTLATVKTPSGIWLRMTPDSLIPTALLKPPMPIPG